MNNESVKPQISNKKGSPLYAILVGVLVDIGGSTIFGILYAIGYLIILSSQEVSFDQIGNILTAIHSDSRASILLYTVGCVISTFAGYICARIVNFSELKYTSILAAISSLYGFLIVPTSYSIIQKIVLLFLTFGSVMLGAFIYVYNKNRKRGHSIIPVSSIFLTA